MILTLNESKIVYLKSLLLQAVLETKSIVNNIKKSANFQIESTPSDTGLHRPHTYPSLFDAFFSRPHHH